MDAHGLWMGHVEFFETGEVGPTSVHRGGTEDVLSERLLVE